MPHIGLIRHGCGPQGLPSTCSTDQGQKLCGFGLAFASTLLSPNRLCNMVLSSMLSLFDSGSVFWCFWVSSPSRRIRSVVGIVEKVEWREHAYTSGVWLNRTQSFGRFVNQSDGQKTEKKPELLGCIASGLDLTVDNVNSCRRKLLEKMTSQTRLIRSGRLLAG